MFNFLDSMFKEILNTPVDIVILVSVVFSINFIRFVLLAETLFIGINAKEKVSLQKKN